MDNRLRCSWLHVLAHTSLRLPKNQWESVLRSAGSIIQCYTRNVHIHELVKGVDVARQQLARWPAMHTDYTRPGRGRGAQAGEDQVDGAVALPASQSRAALTACVLMSFCVLASAASPVQFNSSSMPFSWVGSVLTFCRTSLELTVRTVVNRSWLLSWPATLKARPKMVTMEGHLMAMGCRVVVFMVMFAAMVLSMHSATWLLLEGREKAAATNPLATAKLCRHT